MINCHQDPIQPNQISPLKRLGQNFLNNPKIVKDIVDAANLSPTDTVLEIGPGKGALTKQIVTNSPNMICVEKDPRLALLLKQNFSQDKFPKMQILNQDFLKFDLKQLPNDYKCIGSLPFNISKQIIRKLIESTNPPDSIIFVLQKEVAQDYTSNPPKGSFLSNFIQIYGNAQYLFTIKKGNFRPIPKVDGGVVKITIKNGDPNTQNLAVNKQLAKFIKQLFNKPRKTLRNNIKALPKIESETMLEEAKKIIDLNRRPQEIEFTTFKKLFMLYNKHQSDKI